MSVMETENASPSLFSRIRRRCPCSNLQLWAGYFLTLLAIVMFAFLIYAQERTLALILLFFALGVTVTLCLRLIYLSRRRTRPPYRQVPSLWNGGVSGTEIEEPLDPLPHMVDLEGSTSGGEEGPTPGASLRDEMMVMQLQLMEMQQYRRWTRRERDRQRGLARLGFTPTTSSGASTHLQVSMLDREFGPNDYEMLLKLDDELARNQAARIPQGSALPGGLSLSQINLFPSFILPAPEAGSKEETKGEFEKKLSTPLATSLSENCAVCLEPKVPGEVLRTVPCLHTFHVQCIDPWLQLKRTCPVCKMDFTQGA